MKSVLVVLALVALVAADHPTGGKWVQMIPSGPYFPQGRYFHAQVDMGDDAYIFGGQSGSTYFKDLFVYSVEQNQVQLVDSGSGPSARSGACAVSLGQIVDTFVDTNNVTQTVIVRNATIVIMGGFDGTNYLSDVWEFNLGTGIWSQAFSTGAPAGRAFHTCIDIGTSGAEELLIFGGTNGNYYFGVSDSSLLDYNSNTWNAVPDNTPNGIYPSGRAYVSGVNNGGNLYFYGGYNSDDGCLQDTWLWNANLTAWFAVPTPDTPGPLAAYAGFADGGSYEIYGGFQNCNAVSSTVWSLSHNSPDWKISPPSGTIPPPRAATVATRHGKEYLMYGGATGSVVNGTLTVGSVYDDLWLYVLN